MSDSEGTDQDRTLFVGNLSEHVSEEILYELFLQGGPLDDVKIIKEPSSGRPRGFGFVTYQHKCSLPYAMQLFSGTKLYDRELNVKHTHGNSGGSTSNNNSSSRDSPPQRPNANVQFPSPYAIQPSLQGFGRSHASNTQMLPEQLLAAQMAQLVPNFGLPNNPMLDPALLESLGSQLLLTNPNLLLGGVGGIGDGGGGGHDLFKHSGRERRHNWRDEKPYSHHDRARDNYRERDNRPRHHRQHDNRHDNRRRR